METTLLGLDMPKVHQQLKRILTQKGYLVQTMPTANPVIIAYQEGNWLRGPKQLVLELISIEKNMTKIEITAIINDSKNSRHAEEVIEENLVTWLYNKFKKVIRSQNGV